MPRQPTKVMTRVVASLTLAGTAVFSIWAAPLAAADDTGVSPDQSQTVEEAPLTPEQVFENQEKDRLALLWGAYLQTGVASPEVAQLLVPDHEAGQGNQFFIRAAANMTIHKQQESYTCGPGSLRNMVRS